MLVFDYTGGGVTIQDNTQALVLVESVKTVSGFQPFQVITPVVDVTEPKRILVRTRPEQRSGMIVEWRCSNMHFSPGSSSPAWQTGEPAEGRYWQARVTVTDSSIILDRIEFLDYEQIKREQALSTSF